MTVMVGVCSVCAVLVLLVEVDWWVMGCGVMWIGE
jgi:hypothetical protein